MKLDRKWFIFAGDFIAFWISFLLLISIRNNELYPILALRQHFLPFSVLLAVWILCFFLFGLYDLLKIKPTIPHIKRFVFALTACFVSGIVLFYLTPIFGISPKTNLLFQVFSFGIISFFFRRILFKTYSKQIQRSTIVIGKKPKEFYQIIEANPQLGLKMVANCENLKEALSQNIDLKNSILIFENEPQEISKENMITILQNKVEITDTAKAYEKYLLKIPTDHLSQAWIIKNIQIKKNAFYNSFLRISDILISFLVLILFSPFLLLSALFIYLYDHGPIFYTHSRVGLNGKIFKIYKLRSMIENSEENGVVWAKKDDPRITPIGKIIRKLHLDEIPQMINVIKGDLSLIGPRPERPEFVELLEKEIPYYWLRHTVRPGFTGWAQIKYQYARSVEDSKQKFEYDLYYIKNRNIFLDFGILLRTVQIIFTH